MTLREILRPTLLLMGSICFLAAQDPTGTLKGHVSDKKGGMIGGAAVAVRNLQTGYMPTQASAGSIPVVSARSLMKS